MADKRVTSSILVGVSLIVIMAITIMRNYKNQGDINLNYMEPLKVVEQTADPLAFIKEDYTVDEGFSSNLPIVILDMAGKEPPITTEYDEKQEKYLVIKNLEPYVEGKIQIIDNVAENNAENHIEDNPITESLIRIKRRGNSSMLYDKPQYLVKLVTDKGKNRDLSILNMGEDNEWILNGSMTDKSMMRNYLSYRIASQIIPYTPDMQYCEVIIKNGETYKYQGVYLLGESVKQGEDRVNISDDSPSNGYSSYLVRRDRYEEDRIMLDTYATQKQLTYGYLGLLYPNKNNVTEATLNYIKADISRIERTLYTDNFSEFSRYSKYIDEDSFIDYFLVNEFFGNYDAGNNSTYMYKDIGGKLCIGPVWDYDGAMDNFTETPMEPKDLAFQEKPWFDRLVKDKKFVKKLGTRYADLRRDELSERTIIDLIDEIQSYIANAQVREWMRWNEQYTKGNNYSLKNHEDDDGYILYRETTEYEQEIYRLKAIIRTHGDKIAPKLTLLEKRVKCDTGWQGYIGFILFFCAAIFIIPLVYINKR